MTPSISKTMVLEESAEELLLRKRILSTETKPPQQKDHNNNNDNNQLEGATESYKIDDINYLRAETEKRTSQRDATSEPDSVDTKPDYSNWKPEIR